MGKDSGQHFREPREGPGLERRPLGRREHGPAPHDALGREEDGAKGAALTVHWFILSFHQQHLTGCFDVSGLGSSDPETLGGATRWGRRVLHEEGEIDD